MNPSYLSKAFNGLRSVGELVLNAFNEVLMTEVFVINNKQMGEGWPVQVSSPSILSDNDLNYPHITGHEIITADNFECPDWKNKLKAAEENPHITVHRLMIPKNWQVSLKQEYGVSSKFGLQRI